MEKIETTATLPPPAGRLSLGGVSRVRAAAILVVLALALVYPWVFNSPFPQGLMLLVFMYASLAQAWNILGGFGGRISLGNAAFFGIGAYTSTVLMTKVGLSPWIGMPIGGVIAAAMAIVIGYPCLRLGGHYFAIAMVAAAEIIKTLFQNWDLVNKAIGIYLPILPESMVNLQFHSSKMPYYYISLALLVATMLVAWLVLHSRLGFYLRAIKGDEDAARAIGINVTRYKLMGIAVLAFITAACGTFYAQYVLFIDPDSVMGLQLSITIALIAILGGAGSFWGPILGAAVLIPLSEGTRILWGGTGNSVDLVIYGLLIVSIAVFEPSGLNGLAQRLFGERKRRGTA